LRLGLTNYVRLDLAVVDRGEQVTTRTIPNYQGQPLWVGARETPLAVPAAARQKYRSFRYFPDPQVLPNPPVDLKPRMELRITLYYPGSGPDPKLYLDPPQGAITVLPTGWGRDTIQVEELHGP
jgi:hypothetical protein